MDMRQISEADWRHLRHLEPLILERFCERALTEAKRVMGNGTSPSERFLEVVRAVQEREDDREEIFGELKRSVALLKLARMRALGLLTDEEFAGFGEESRAAVGVLLELWS